ncbi:hypothetical protein Vafri_9271 [Volvox africanus]|uniref:SGNH domain-containing protein n=1 Tax=Volvox africanus TaxID=51714 RepID=A0A8J4EZS7_9CHLO|nr:hypothetical protein Vafri_9271 [Volvox africanus]
MSQQLAAIWQLLHAFLILSACSTCLAIRYFLPPYYHSVAQHRGLVHGPERQDVSHNNTLIPSTHETKWPASVPKSDVVTWTEMNCTNEDFLPSSNYRGLECHVANLWPEDNCPIVGLNMPSCSRCTMWRRGRLPPTVLAKPTQYYHNARPQACDGTIWAFGRWNGEEWLPSEIYPQCNNVTLSPADVYQCLKGRRVMLFGDSMIRPLLGRLAAYLRGIPQFLDHISHVPAYYMANGTHDAFVEDACLPSLHASGKAKDPNKYSMPQSVLHEASWNPRDTLEMQFYWAPQFDKGDVNVPSLEELFGALDGSDVMIAGPMYHVTGDYQSFRTELQKFFQKLASAGKRVSHFFWIASIPNAEQKVQEFGERNRLMRSFVEMLNEQSLTGSVSVPRYSHYVDAPMMVHNAPMKRIDAHHYQCTKQPMFPGALLSDVTELPKSMDCRDILHLNLLLSMWKVACDDLARS